MNKLITEWHNLALVGTGLLQLDLQDLKSYTQDNVSMNHDMLGHLGLCRFNSCEG